MRKVNLNVIKPWIAKKIVELVGFEDDILIGYALELLDEPVIASPRANLPSSYTNNSLPTLRKCNSL
jgi:hypothetical protein